MYCTETTRRIQRKVLWSCVCSKLTLGPLAKNMRTHDNNKALEVLRTTLMGLDALHQKRICLAMINTSE